MLRRANDDSQIRIKFLLTFAIYAICHCILLIDGTMWTLRYLETLTCLTNKSSTPILTNTLTLTVCCVVSNNDSLDRVVC